MKGRLRGIENRNKLRDDKTNKDKPTLRTRTRAGPAASGSGWTTAHRAGRRKHILPDDPDRPTLKAATGGRSKRTV